MATGVGITYRFADEPHGRVGMCWRVVTATRHAIVEFVANPESLFL
jgi:hypothetical protein